jgi:Fe-Mn family superoxide dismutase
MKNNIIMKSPVFFILFYFILNTILQRQKFTEVVRVPLPTTEQPATIMGSPDDVKADEGSFQLVPYL